MFLKKSSKQKVQKQNQEDEALPLCHGGARVLWQKKLASLYIARTPNIRAIQFKIYNYN